MATKTHSTISILFLFFSFFSNDSSADIIELNSFGKNPGSLDATFFRPKKEHPPLVVLLHGCAQHGNELAEKSGLLGLAKQKEFALLMPQQRLTNNIKRCFNWYAADDYSKNKGENLSIKNMIMTLKKKLGSEHVYILGLSGGGAMASSMLVNYPELFKAGGIVAGIPFPCADGLITAISCMKNGPSQTIDELASIVKKRHPKRQQWPKLSIWSGKKDNIVNPFNSSMHAQQWALLSSLKNKPKIDKNLDYTITRWLDEDHKVQIELIEMDNLGHGIMVNPKLKHGGEVADYLLASSISTSKHIIKFWNL